MSFAKSGQQLLDSDRIVRLRLQVHLSQARLARQLGIATPTYQAIERDIGHGQITLSLLNRLATALGTEPSVLLADQQAKTPQVPASDDIRLEAALLVAEIKLPAAIVADALGWDLRRVVEAGRRLSDRLIGTGSQLHRDSGYRVRAKTHLLSNKEVAALTGYRPRLRGLTRSHARLLRRAIEQREVPTWTRTLRESDRPVLAALVNQGLLVVTHDRVHPSHELLDSLGLTGPTRAVWQGDD